MEKIFLLVSKVLPHRVMRMFEGFWIMPVSLSIVGIAAGAGIGAVPDRILGWRWHRLVEDLEPAVSRMVLTTIATGVMTAASIVFSLAFLTLSITAQQLSPRILDFVLRERAMQVMIGMAIATFLFCVVALLSTGINGAAVTLAATISVPLAAVTLLMVVMFAFSMTRIIRADEMVARLGDAFVAAMHRAVKPPEGCHAIAGEAPDFTEGTDVLSEKVGHAGTIDHGALLDLAAASDLRIALDLRANDFVLSGQRVARVLGLHPGQEPPSGEIGDALNLTDRRAPSFGADYEGASLSEAAIRALSPGINDPATARAALNRLFEGLVILATGNEPARLLGKEEGVALVVRPVRGLGDYLGEIVAPVAEAAARDTQVTKWIVALTDQLASVAVRASDRAAIAAFRAAVDEGKPGTVISAPGS